MRRDDSMNQYVKRVSDSNRIIIYGAGKIAQTVYNELQEYGLSNKIICFAVSDDRQDANRKLNGIKIIPIGQLKEYYGNTLFLIAVGEALSAEIEATLMQLDISDYFQAQMIYIGEWYSERNRDYIERYIAAEQGNWTDMSDNSDYISHVTYCTASNAGDTMLSKCVRKYIDYPRWNIIDVRQKVTDDMIDKINHGRALVIGGGGLFLPDTNENSISGWQWAISDEQLEKITVPIIVYAVGYNYFRGQEPNKLFENSLAKLVRKAEFIGLRNNGSIRKVNKIIGEEIGKKIVYQPCMTTMISKLYSIEKRNDTKMIGINIAFDRENLRFGNMKKEILSETARAFKEIQNMGYQLLYIAHTDGDLRFLKYMDYYNVQYDVENLTNEFPEKIIETYKRLQCVIGMRGHAQMIPFGVGCRIITLGSHDKMRWFLEDVTMQSAYVDLVEDINNISKNIVNIFLENNVKNATETDAKIAAEKERLWEISCKNKEYIISKIF